MIFYRFLMFVVICFGGYMIYRVAISSWKKSSVDDKLDEIELEKEIHEHIQEVDEEEAKHNKEDIDNFLKS